MLGTLCIGAGALLSGARASTLGARLRYKGRVLLDRLPAVPEGMEEAVRFPLVEALHGRRSRRFSLGASIHDGPLAYASQHEPVPLSEMEQMMLLTAVAGNTGWHYLIPHNPNYGPHIPNYAGTAGGRTFPSAAGFHTVEFFYTDDEGVYFLPTRDAPALLTADEQGATDLAAYLSAHKARLRKVADERLHIPARPEHIEMHNPWCVNVPGSTLVIPVADLAQHQLLALCYLVQNGACLYDDVNGTPIPGMDAFADLVDVENPYPLSYIEQFSLTEATVELSTACYAGALMLQAMGLGGWMFDGISPFSVLGASGDPEVPGLGFRYEVDERWPLPFVTGRPGVFEAHCPPHHASMRDAVDAVVRRKFGPGGPFHAATPGPYQDPARVRGSAQEHDDRFRACVTTMADYVYDRFGRFPATVPAVFVLMYLQAHHLDPAFYDEHFEAGAYLKTHADHMTRWHA